MSRAFLKHSSFYYWRGISVLFFLQGGRGEAVRKIIVSDEAVFFVNCPVLLDGKEYISEDEMK